MKKLSELKRETLKVGFLTFVANMIGKLISIPVGIFVAGFLGPNAFGLLAIVNQIKTFLGYGNLGMLMNLTRELPIAYGKNDVEEVQTIKDVVFTNYSITTILGLFVIWALFLVGFDFNDVLENPIMITLTILVITSNADSFLHTYVKGEGKFLVFGQYELVIKILGPVITFASVYLFSLYGMLASLILAHIVGFVFVLYRIDPPKLRFKFNLKKTKELLSTSVLMYLNKLLDTFLISISVIIAGVYFTLTDVGVLSYALVIASTTQIPFADIFAMTTDRTMALQSGKVGSNDFVSFQRFLRLPLVMYSLLSSTVLGVIVIFYSLSIEVFLHKYEPSLPMFIFLYFAMVYYNTRHFLYSYINATRQMNRRLIILILGVAIHVLVSVIMIIFGGGVISIVYGITIAFIFVSCNIIYTVFKQVYEGTIEAVEFITKISIIAIVLTIILYIFSEFKYLHPEEIMSLNLAYIFFAIIELFLKTVVFALSSVFLYGFLFKEYKVFNEIKDYIKYFTSIIKMRLSA